MIEKLIMVWEYNLHFERESVGEDQKIHQQFSTLQHVKLQSVKYRQIFIQIWMLPCCEQWQEEKKVGRKSVYIHFIQDEESLVTSTSVNGKFQDPEHNHVHQHHVKLMTLKNISKWAARWQIKFVVDTSKAQQIRNNHQRCSSNYWALSYSTIQKRVLSMTVGR